MNCEISSSFIINSGLKQGDAVSPVLFNMALESIIRKVPRTETTQFNEENILLVYANNIEIIGKSGEEIEGGVTELVNIGKGFGLIINNEKTKYLMVARGGDHNNYV